MKDIAHELSTIIMENSCTALLSKRVGFQLFPPLINANDLLRWNGFIALVTELFAACVVVTNDRITFTVKNEESDLPKDGIYFREFTFARSSISEKLTAQITRLACGFFPMHTVNLDIAKYTREEKLSAYNLLIASTMRSCRRIMDHFRAQPVCAFCINTCEDNEKVIVCCSCNRRSYCSSKCMELDADACGTGQGHSMWCSLGVCEEGLDWVVEPVPGKGLGVVARREIKSRSRIMVDRPRHILFPAVLDLEPSTGTLVEKQQLNSFTLPSVTDMDSKQTDSLLCLRVARINHSCQPNSSQVFDSDMGVMIVVANRDIHVGEEICISYLNSFGRNSPHSPETGANLLREKWNIECPADCSCWDLNVQSALRKLRQIHMALESDSDDPYLVQKFEDLITLLYESEVAWVWRLDALWDAFETLSGDSSATDIAKAFGAKALQISSSIFHPLSERHLEMNERLETLGSSTSVQLPTAAQSA